MSEKYLEVLKDVIAGRGDQDEIRASWVANEAYKRLDPEGKTPYEVRHPALIHMRQSASSLIRGKYQSADGAISEQHELFPTLQKMYPVPDEKDCVSRKLELLTFEQCMWNVRHLRQEGKTKLKHADALEQWALDNYGRATAAA
jgi:hypothetical protein